MADTTTETPTDLIVRAMEQADDMEIVIVLYRLKSQPGVGWCSNATTWDAVTMMEYAKAGLLLQRTDE